MKSKNALFLISLLFVSLSLMTSTILADDYNEATTSMIKYTNNGENNFNLPGVAIGGAIIDGMTSIRVTKQIMASGSRNSPDIKLTLQMPPRPAKIDIVLAMDTSGSMVQNYLQGKSYLEWVSKIIPAIVEKFPEARVSIVSWDDENEVGDKMTRFYNASNEKDAINYELSTLPSECLETDNTIYSIGVKRALQVLDNKTNWPKDPYNTSRIIIFVTGLSEFRAEPKNASNDMTLGYQLENARLNRTYDTPTNFSGYQIFPVPIGMDDHPENSRLERENLSRILNDTSIMNHPVLTKPISDINNLDSVVKNILNELQPVARDVEVVDTLYPYLNYSGSDNDKRVPVQRKNSSDGSTTLIWNISMMNGSESWSATIHTKLNLSLPVEVTLNRSERRYAIANTTPISEIKYIWITGYKGDISLPEGTVIFSSPDSVGARNNVFANDTTRLTIKAVSAERSAQRAPGFELYSAFSGIIFVTFLLRSRKIG